MRTYADLIDHLSRIVWGYGKSASADQIRTAIGSAYAALPLYGSWRRYETRYRICTRAVQSGSVSVADNGTAVVLTSGTWPSWAVNSTLHVNGLACRIASIASTTKAILADGLPASWTDTYSYTLFNDYHVLPSDFLAAISIQVLEPIGLELLPARQYEISRRHGALPYSGTPQWYSLERGVLTGLRLIPAPSSETVLDVYYRRTLLPLLHTGTQDQDCQGTVSVSGTTVTGTGTAFSADMEDCVIRIGTSDYCPDGPEGYNPYKEEQLIASVTSATQLTVVAPFQGSWTNVKYRITDVLDVDENLYQLLVSLSLAELAKIIALPVNVDVDEEVRRALSADAHQMGPIPLLRAPPARVAGKLRIDLT